MGCDRRASTSAPPNAPKAVTSTASTAPSAQSSVQPDAGDHDRPPSKALQACPRKRTFPFRVSEATALDEQPVLQPLLVAGASGNPRRVRLRFHHPIAGCECPSFSLSDYEGDPEVVLSHDEAAIQSWVYAVFPEDVPDGHQFESGKHYGTTRYELTGYFSGRMIDYYDFLSAQSGEPRGKPWGGEQESDREARYAEFCVEDWCYRPDPNPVRHKEILSPSEFAKDLAEYKRTLAEMERAGAKRCSAGQGG